jgi:hypothetical protein
MPHHTRVVPSRYLIAKQSAASTATLTHQTHCCGVRAESASHNTCRYGGAVAVVVCAWLICVFNRSTLCSTPCQCSSWMDRLLSSQSCPLDAETEHFYWTNSALAGKANCAIRWPARRATRAQLWQLSTRHRRFASSVIFSVLELH